MKTRATNPKGRKSTIPKSVRDLALAHKVNVGRDEHGNYFIRDPQTGKWAAHTASANPSAAMAKAMIRKYVRGRKKNPAVKGASEFIIVAVDKRQGQVRYWKGMEWGLKREWAARWGTKEMARSAAMDVSAPSKWLVAVVPRGMAEAKIRDALGKQ